MYFFDGYGWNIATNKPIRSFDNDVIVFKGGHEFYYDTGELIVEEGTDFEFYGINVMATLFVKHCKNGNNVSVNGDVKGNIVNGNNNYIG